MLAIMTPRAAAVWVVLALALAGCGERHAPAAAKRGAACATPRAAALTPEAAAPTPEAAAPVPTPEVRAALPPAAACVRAGAPYALARSRLRMARRSVVTGDLRRLDPLVFTPRAGGRCPRPLVVFSHGHYGDPASCADLCARLASAGLIVVAPRHEDRAVDRIPLQAGERVDDVLWVLDHLRLRHDRMRIGLAGHSFGGVTAGQAASQDPRPRAVVSLAGTADHGTMTSTTAPTLIIAGSEDRIETAEASRTSAAAIPATVPHELVVVPGAAHGDLLRDCVVCDRVEAWLTRYLAGPRAG
jgi:dienelactone hydrolase